ncbi:MAG TPA: BlaI/MecI/CopY family transcriptional regulator, partial [Phycisphaerae bacterium]|nr:BlaI/MecI/CopY family transcriptional regulator [Phycisphaerae bacterium]
YVYRPTRPQQEAARSALKRLLETFFDGSAEKALAALLDASDVELPPEELERLAKLIEKARKEGD